MDDFEGATMILRWKSVLASGGVVLAAAAAAVTSGLKAAEPAPKPPVVPPTSYSAPEDCEVECEVERPRRWSKRWYEERAQSPVGARQKKKKGKLWPPFPRPTGKEQQFSHRYHAAHYWPFPYVCDDRAYVRELSGRQIESGWITATTLYDYHFDETHAINTAGRLHLRWILESAPVARRMVYVQSTFAPESNDIRLASARAELAGMLGPEPPPPVMLRVAPLAGRPALEIDLIRRAERDNLPIPHIPYSPNPTSGSGGETGTGM